MIDSTRLIQGLNDPQREAVEAIDGPVLVLAGPGSGKTRVLTHRVAFLVGVAGVPPWYLMAVTFTNKAAREMKERLEPLIGPEALGQLTMGTFHAICARILRREADSAALGFDNRFVIFDTDDQLRVVKKALGELNLDDKVYRPRAVLGAISNAKNELIRPEAYAAPSYWHEVASRIYKRYQELLRENNALDFDDLLLESAELLREDSPLRRRYRERYGFLMVDEFQDTNTAQYALLKALAAAEDPNASHNLFAVGDEDQSIYRWRGADYRNIQRFRKDFPESRVILLEQNYRSTQTILDAAQSVITRNANRTDKDLWTEAGGGEKISLFEAYDENEEAAYILREIEKRVAGGGRYRDIAVMYRTNAQSRVIEDAFVRKRVPYQLVGGTRFYDRKEIRDVMAYLRFVYNPRDEIALQRIINTPPRSIGPKAWATLSRWAQALGASMWEALAFIASSDDLDGATGLDGAPQIDTRSRNALGRFHEAMNGVIGARERLPAPALLEKLLADSGYVRWLRDGSDEGEDRWENVQELLGVAHEFESLPPLDGLGAMLESIALASDVDGLQAGPDSVTLLTLHAAKGLEYPVVFIPGIEERVLPHSRSIDDPEALAEERRLFYVGVTRAMRKLHLIHAFRRTIFGASELAEPSRFLADIPAECIDQKQQVTRTGRGTGGGSRHHGAKARATQWNRAPAKRSQEPAGRYTNRRPAAAAASPAATETAFRAGDRVVHGHFGMGVVVTSRLRDGDEEVTVAFKGAGVKKLMQEFAKLEKA